MKVINVSKGGGGGSTHTPVESEDNLISKDYIKVLLALSDGEVDEEFSTDQLLLNDVPVTSGGIVNYEGVSAEFRPGTQDQEYIQGFTESNNEITVNRSVTTNTPYVISVTNQVLSAIRVRLFTNRFTEVLSNNDTVGSKVNYHIDIAVDGGAYTTVIDGVKEGKNTSGYDWSHRIDLPLNYNQVLIRVSRITPDSTSDMVQNAISVQSYSEVIDAKFRYPLTSLLFVQFDSKLFPNQLPTISLKKKWKKILIPSNYDPINRTYSGVWDGSFKLAWSNNPAWVLYDLIVNQRYGLDQRELGIAVDKWSLYEAGQYCDQLVPDGSGGMEPRYLCDMVVQDRVEAYQLVRDVCSIFRGMSFYNGESLSIVIDKPRDPVYLFTNDNVIQGKFTRTFASDKSVYTSCNVTFDDAQNMYNQDVEPVFDVEASRRFGNNPTDITAIGCTRRSEANRRGRWIVKTNLRSTTVTFGTGLEGMIPMVGDVISVADSHWQSAETLNLSGRLAEVSGLQVFFNFKVDARAGDFIVINRPDGVPQKRTIASVSSDGKTITLNVGFGFDVQNDAVFAISRNDLALEQYVVTKIEKGEGDDEFAFNITAVEYDATKYDAIDYGVIVDSRPTSVVDPDVMPAPKNVRISSYSSIQQGLSVETMVVGWDQVPYAAIYEVQWKKDTNNWQNTPQTATNQCEVVGIYAGTYQVRVRCASAGGNYSPWSEIATAGLTGKVGKPVAPINLTATQDQVFGIRVKWGFGENSGDTAYTELQQSKTGEVDSASLITLVPYPQAEYWHSVLPAGYTNFYRIRAVDRIGNVSDWTDFVYGMATDDVDDIAAVVKIDIENSDAYKELKESVFEQQQQIKNIVGTAKGSAEAAIQNALANNTDVVRMTKENSGRKAEYRVAVQLIADETQARVSALTQLEADINDNVKASISRLDEAIATEGETRAREINQLKTQINDEISAEITQINQAISNLESSTAQSIQDLNTKFGQNSSSIQNLQQVVTDLSSSTAQQISSLNSRVGNNESAITQKVNTYATSNGTVGGTYSVNLGVKVNGQALDSGFAISVDNSSGSPKARAFFDVDQFAIGRIGSGTSIPFFIENGQTFIQGAVIKDGTITNAKISGAITSNNFVGGKQGWSLDKNGIFLVNLGNGTSGGIVLDGNGLAVFDSSGNERVRLGAL